MFYPYAVIFKRRKMGWDRLRVLRKRVRWALHSSYECNLPRPRRQRTTVPLVVWSNGRFSHLFHPLEPWTHYVSTSNSLSFESERGWYFFFFGTLAIICCLSVRICTASMWMTFQLENSRRWRIFRSRRTRRWEFTQLYGMPMTGQRKADVWRQTGAMHHLLLPTETSMLMHVFGQMAHLLATQMIHLLDGAVSPGYGSGLMMESEDRWNGCRTTTWYTITAKTINVFPTVLPPNARALNNKY